MITLTAKIELINSSGGLKLSENLGNYPNNISKDIESMVNRRVSPTKNPFLIGASKLGDGVFCEQVDYFISNSTDLYAIKISSGAGKKISSFTISFDTYNLIFPKKIEVENDKGVVSEYSNDDAIFTWSNLEESDYFYLGFSEMNKENFPLIITGIYEEVVININNRNLIDFSRKIMDRADISFPSYGIISNTGSISFKDLDGEIKDYVEQNILKSDMNVTVGIKNTLIRKEPFAFQQIAVFETKELDYDNDNRSITISLKDDLEEWQDIQIDAVDYDPRDPTKVFVYPIDIYKYLWSKTPQKYNMVSFDLLDKETLKAISNIVFDYPFLKSGNLWSKWQQFCEACGCYIYKDSDGKTKFHHSYGS